MARAASGPAFFGTNLQTLGAVTPGARDGVLAQLGTHGMDLDRIEVNWSMVEPSAPTGGVHRYVWTSTDATIKSMASHGLRAVPLFRFTPTWVHLADATKPGGVDVLPPARYGDFAAFIAAFAARYGENGAFWQDPANASLPSLPVLSYEAWNEVNLAEYAWNGKTDPAAYAVLLQTIRPALKKVQPNGILLGSLAYQEEEAPNYVADLAAAGGLDAVDAMGYHPYAPDALSTLDLVEHLRALLAAAGHPDLPIFANEGGQEAVVTNPDGSLTPNVTPATWAYDHFPTDAARAASLAFAGEALAQSDCGVEQFLPYSVSGSEKDGEKLTEAYMGLFRPATGAPTQTAQALFRATSRWRGRFAPGGPGVGQRLALCGGGITPDAAMLPIDVTYTGSASNGLNCVTAHASYDGNPLESATLALSTPDGRQVAGQQTNAFGDATSCMPHGPSQDDFRALVSIPNAGRGGTVLCDVPDMGCPAGATLHPSPGATLSASVATGRAEVPPTPTPEPTPAPSIADCQWKSTTRQVGFTPGGGGKLSTARFAAKLRCDSAPVGRAFRFAVRVRVKGTRERSKARTVWLPNRVERRFTLSGRFKSGHKVVVTYKQQPGTGIPQLSDTVTLRVAPRRR